MTGGALLGNDGGEGCPKASHMLSHMREGRESQRPDSGGGGGSPPLHREFSDVPLHILLFKDGLIGQF